jgi:DNA adenine methylase
MNSGLQVPTVSQPLKWHGGKYYLASRIIELFPEHTHYVEPFFGGGAVFFAKPPRYIEEHSEAINDLNGDLMNFWKVLRDPLQFADFQRLVEATPFSKPEFIDACEDVSAAHPSDPVWRALAFFVKYRQSRQGLGTSFATMSRSRTRRGMNEQVSSWLSAIKGLPEAHARLKRVVIFHEDALEVIRREDSEHTFFYLDPPYMFGTRSATTCYEHEMQDAAHLNMLELLSKLRGKFLLSGYSNPHYEAACTRNQWSKVEIPIDNKSSNSKEKEMKLECLWMNFGKDDPLSKFMI